jgi:hypothetical protein
MSRGVEGREGEEEDDEEEEAEKDADLISFI